MVEVVRAAEQTTTTTTKSSQQPAAAAVGDDVVGSDSVININIVERVHFENSEQNIEE